MTHLVQPEPRQLVGRRQFLQITAASAAAAGLYYAGRRIPWGRAPVTVRETRTLMGTVVNLAVVGPDERAARAAAAATLAEMERLIAIFDHRRPESPLAVLNRTGRLAAPPAELVALVERAQLYGDLTGGAFDVSVKPLIDGYRDGVPAAAERRSLVDYRQIAAGAGEIVLGRPGMALTFDGIAKGRVVDGAAAVLQQHGFANVLVEAGGDLTALGERAAEDPWRVGVQHPRGSGRDLVGLLTISRQALATSGDYQNSFSQDFSRHHIVDPRSGLSPAELASVTVLAPTAADADALSTALLVLGVEEGLALAGRLSHVEALVITKEMEIHHTAQFPLLAGEFGPVRPPEASVLGEKMDV